MKIGIQTPNFHDMLARDRHVREVERRLRENPVVAVIGARQVGKTTLAALVTDRRRGPIRRFDLEKPADLARLDDPYRALEEQRGLVVLDEIQRLPDVFPVLRVLADRPRTPARFLVLGSASPDLLRQSSESLAGRISYYQLPGFTLDEVGSKGMGRLWLRGGFPRSYLATSDRRSVDWRNDFLRTFLERDLPQLDIRVPADTLLRFWTMLAHYHGQIWNASEFARSLGSNHKTARRYLDILTSTYVVRSLPPWHENITKRQVKSPKTYLADSGLLHALLGIGTKDALEGHPKVGASWEGFLLHEVLQCLGARSREAFFWATHAGPELDLLVVRGTRRLGFEFKRTVAPRVTKSMNEALRLLSLTSMTVVHAGTESFSMRPKIRAIAASRIIEDVKPLR